MQIDQEELNRRLNSTKNLIQTIPVPKQAEQNTPKVVDEGINSIQTPRISNGLRIIAGSLAHQMPAGDVAEGLGIKVTQVNSAKYSKNPIVRKGIEESLNRVQELALDKMIFALGLMDHRMEDCNMKDLSIIAANMSRIVEKTRTQDEKTSVVLHLYSPEVRSQSSYKVIDV